MCAMSLIKKILEKSKQGNFKNPDNTRKIYIEPDAKDKNTGIQVAINENFNIYVKKTNKNDYRKNELKKI